MNENSGLSNSIDELRKILLTDEIFWKYQEAHPDHKDFCEFLIDSKNEVEKNYGKEMADEFEKYYLEKWTISNKGQKQLVTCENGVFKKTLPRKKIQYKTASMLISEDLPEPEFIVDNLISKGLVIVSAKSKIGKSWFVFDLGIAVASGGEFLGVPANKGKVLYLDLEESETHCQKRLKKILGNVPAPEDLIICNEFSTFNDYFLEDMTEFLDENRDTTLVIVDVFQKIKKAKKSNQSDYEDIYSCFEPLKQLSINYNISIVLVMHDRKMQDTTDPFANILGSTAIMGASDEAIVINKQKRTDDDATLSITGRTVETNEYAIQFDKSACKWKMLGVSQDVFEKKAEMDYRNNPLVKTILKLVSTNGGKYSGGTREILSASKYIAPVHLTEQKAGRDIPSLSAKLLKYDGIIYSSDKKGTASRVHTFEKSV